jgi:hypothetical protein
MRSCWLGYAGDIPDVDAHFLLDRRNEPIELDWGAFGHELDPAVG